MSYLKIIILGCSFLLLLFSCAGWRAENTPELGAIPLEVNEVKERFKTGVKLKIYEVYESGELLELEMNQAAREKTQMLIQKPYRAAKLFDVVDNNSPNKQLTAEISVVRKRDASLTSDILTAISLYLIPKSTNEEITVTTKFFNKKSELIGMVEKTETVVVWHQLFMIFALPFNVPSTVKDETLIDLGRATILEAVNEGHFVELTN